MIIIKVKKSLVIRIITYLVVVSLLSSLYGLATTGYSEGITADMSISSGFFIVAYNLSVEQIVQLYIEDEEQKNAYVSLLEVKRDTSKDTDEMAVFSSSAGYEIHLYFNCERVEYVAKLDNPFPDYSKEKFSQLDVLLVLNFLRLSLFFMNSDTEENQSIISQWVYNNQRDTYEGDKYVLDYNYDLDGYSHFSITSL